MEMNVADAKCSSFCFPLLVVTLVGGKRVPCGDNLTFYNHCYLWVDVDFFDEVII